MNRDGSLILKYCDIGSDGGNWRCCVSQRDFDGESVREGGWGGSCRVGSFSQPQFYILILHLFSLAVHMIIRTLLRHLFSILPKHQGLKLNRGRKNLLLNFLLCFWNQLGSIVDVS